MSKIKIWQDKKFKKETEEMRKEFKKVCLKEMGKVRHDVK